MNAAATELGQKKDFLVAELSHGSAEQGEKSQLVTGIGEEGRQAYNVADFLPLPKPDAARDDIRNPAPGQLLFQSPQDDIAARQKNGHVLPRERLGLAVFDNVLGLTPKRFQLVHDRLNLPARKIL